MVNLRWRNTLPGLLRNPFSELERLQKDMDRIWGLFSDVPRHDRGAGVFPALNVSQDEDSLLVRAELPGVKHEDIEVNVQDDKLLIAGQRRMESGDEDVFYHRRERESGTFRRVISLPVPVDADNVSATLADGVLTVILPKAELAKPRKIEVNAS